MDDPALTALNSESIDKLAEQAGIREGARVLLAGASIDEAAASELTTRDAMREYLHQRLYATDQLPPGIAQDLKRFLRPIAERCKPAHPPIITVTSKPWPVHPPDATPTG